MTLQRPTLAGRKGFDPGGIGPGLSAPYGYSSAYFGGSRMHNGQDYFWLGAESAARLGISTEASKGVYAVVDGPVYRVDDSALGLGLYQQIDATHRAYYWHLSERVSNGTYKTTDRIGRMGTTGTAAGTGEHVHFEVREAPYGSANRKDPEPFFRASAALEPNQRQVLPTLPVRRRSQPTSQSPEAGDPLAPNEVGNFNGWIRGESVSGNNVWFRGISGNWFWSGGFTNTGTSGLADLNPTAEKPTRVVRDLTANVRNLPTTNGTEVVGSLAAGAKVEVQGYTKGETVNQSGVTSDIWFRVAAGWAWSGSFTSRDTNGLPLLQSGLPANPGPQLDPTQWKDKEPNTPLAKWVGSPNFNRYEPSADKKWITAHWMAGTLAGTDSQFQIPGTVTEAGRGTNPATNYGVGQTEIHQYIREEHYQHGDGSRESNTYGISIEHEGGPNLPITDAVYANSARLMADIAKRYGWAEIVVYKNLFPHKYWAATECPGTLDLERLAREANAILKPEPEPEPEPERPEDEPPAWFARFLGLIIETINKFLGK